MLRVWPLENLGLKLKVAYSEKHFFCPLSKTTNRRIGSTDNQPVGVLIYLISPHGNAMPKHLIFVNCFSGGIGCQQTSWNGLVLIFSYQTISPVTIRTSVFHFSVDDEKNEKSKMWVFIFNFLFFLLSMENEKWMFIFHFFHISFFISNEL